MVRTLGSLFKETILWAWTRDESHQPTSLRKALYFVVLYGSWLGIVIIAGLVFEYIGNAEAAEAIWLFGVGISVFMGLVDIAWEGLKHLTADRDGSGLALTVGGGREMSQSIRIEDDTWIGFLVTFAALIGLMIAFSVVTSLMGF